LHRLPRQVDPNVLVGFETYDDAGVYLLEGARQALVQTVDILTPIADDPLDFGRIAAANSLSDVYAMGGRPICALSIVCFPERDSPELLEAILRGGVEKMAEAKCTIIGGHSVRDDDLKFGYAVTGLVKPSRIWRNAGAVVGDALLLTKRIGTGVLATALKQGSASTEHMSGAIASMSALNHSAAEALHEVESAAGDGASPIHAVTDVTGFGLLGHLREMAAASNVSARVESARVGYLPGALEAARAGFLSAGLKNNRDFVSSCVGFAGHVPPELRDLLFDPQTSGGLLVSVARDAAQQTLAALRGHGVDTQVVGYTMAKTSPLIDVE